MEPTESTGGNTFDLVSSQLDRLHELLNDSNSDEEDNGRHTSSSTVATTTTLPKNASSEDITNRLKEALQTLDRLDQQVDAFTVDHGDGSDSDGDLETSPWRTRNKSPGEEDGGEGVPPSPSHSRQGSHGSNGGGGGASPGGALASPGGTIMDGWFETHTARRGADGELPPVDYKRKWDKHYCVLTSELTGSMAVGEGGAGGRHAFVLAGFRDQKAFQRRQAPEWLVRLAIAAVSMDVANSSAGAIVISVRSFAPTQAAGGAEEPETGEMVAPPQLYLRSTVSFVAQGWVTGMRGLQLTELLGWSERELCQWLQVGGVGAETLTMIQMFHLDGMYLASLGVPGASGRERDASLVKYLERNLGIADQGECRLLVHLLTEVQAAEVVAWLEDKARELDGRYPAITAAVQFCMSQAHKVEVRTRKAQSPRSPLAVVPAASELLAPEGERRAQPAEEWGGARRREAARSRSAEGRRKEAAAATRIQQVWRGVCDRSALGNLMEALGYFENGVLDTAAFHAQWSQQQQERRRKAAAARGANVSGIAAQMLAAASAQEQAATVIAAGYRAHKQRAAYSRILGRRQQAACDVQSAWRGKATRMGGMVVALPPRQRAALERAIIRRRLRVVWAHFFAWLNQTQQAQAVVQLRERALHGQYLRLLGWAVAQWGESVEVQQQARQAKHLEQQAQLQREAILRSEEAERRSELQAENKRKRAELERQQGEQHAASLLLRALSSRDPELIEQALAAAAPFPGLKSQCEACQKLYQTLVVGLVRQAQHSGDLNLVKQALALARKNNLANSSAQLEAWLKKLGEVKALILQADKSGELAVIGQAIAAAQRYPCFEKQVTALLQMKSLLADVHSLLHQALERQEPADVAMAIKVAARFDAIRSSPQYKRLVALQQQVEGVNGKGASTTPSSPRARNGRTPQRTAEGVPPQRATPRGGGKQPRGITPNREASRSTGGGGAAMATTPGGSGISTPSNKPPRAPAGIRPEVAEMIAHCAEWVAQHGHAFERTLRMKNAGNPAFNFLQYPQSVEAAYYRKCLDHQRGLALVKMSDTGKRRVRRPPPSGGKQQTQRAGSSQRGQRRPNGGGTPARNGGGNGRSSSRASSRGRQERQTPSRGVGGPGTPRGSSSNTGQRQRAGRREFNRSGLSPVSRGVGAAGRQASDGGDKRLVFIWDMDETLIVFQSLVSGSFMNARKMSPQQHTIGKQLGLQMMKLILWPLDNAMFFEQIEQVDKHHVNSLSKFDDHADLRNYDFERDGFRVLDDGDGGGYGEGGRPPSCDLRKLSYRYRQIVQVCARRREGTLEPEILRELKECYEATDRFANGWLTLTKQMLAKVSMIPGAVNVVVSACQLTPTLAKAMIYQLDEYVPSHNVYSGSQIGKLACFNQIIARFGGEAESRFIAVGDGLEEAEISEELDLPFHQIDQLGDLKRLDTQIDARLRYHGLDPAAAVRR